ncbi:hypothetical protein [Halostella litorea]|uniref:hypothetical protein n=1 Tax=Halostella litorea TaxID=2528831 RepID=UPI001091C784|nr:hypothetical protein [Halostella litorea]
MVTFVKIDEETKSRLERLQAEIRVKTGTKVTQQELLERLVNEAVASKTDLIESFREERVPISGTTKAAFHEGTVESGKETDESDIDDILYE